MKSMSNAIIWAITIVLPLFILMTAIQILINPAFALFEYNLPNFPEDPYGFTREERIYYSEFAINYLRNQEGIDYLAELKLPSGDPLYNIRELDHMLDVKILVQQMTTAWYMVFGLLILLGSILSMAGFNHSFWAGLYRGGYLTLGLIFAILLMVFINFNALFTGFHQIFFEGDTWLFLYSDTLIRLFPIKFWQDAFIFLGAFTLLAALLIILISKRILGRIPG